MDNILNHLTILKSNSKEQTLIATNQVLQNTIKSFYEINRFDIIRPSFSCHNIGVKLYINHFVKVVRNIICW